MEKIKDTEQQQNFWSNRYKLEQTGWDIGYPSTPLKEYIDQLDNKELRILIPGAGNAYEAEYLWKNGFKNVYVLDIAAQPLTNFAKRNPDFPKKQLVQGNFFEHEAQYNLILEQTFFCSFPPLPENRKLYAQTTHRLLNPMGKLVGLWFNFPLTNEIEKRPFGGSKEEYTSYFAPYYDILTLEKCTNSIKPRQENELFGILRKK